MALFRRTPAIDIDSLARQVAEQVKATMPGTVGSMQVDPANPLPRGDAFNSGGMYGPGVPFLPAPIDPRDPISHRPAPRRSEFPSSVNLNLTAGRLIPFGVLRDAADKVDVIRRCIEVRKAQILSLDWTITLSSSATKRIMAEDGITKPGEAAQLARRRYEPEMARLREWWETPDRYNNMDFATWLGVLLEEQLVIDAVALWPRRKLSGEVVGLELLDGSTIKPLLDHRGATPLPPAPAYQQVLYGFPRGEFVASSSDEADAFGADQLVYAPRFRRTWTPYGNPNTETALNAADVYLRRIDWMRSEFTEGTTPDTWLRLPESSKIGPDQIIAFETAINAQLAGSVAERKSLHMLPPGAEPVEMNNFADLYKPDLDEFLIKLLCSCFDVMPTEIGFPPGSGIGGKGHQEGEANSSQRKAVRPTATWIENLLTRMSRTYLGMPNELCFKLLGYEVEDQNQAELVADSQTRRGGLTLNDDRAARGMPLYEFAEADVPFVVTGSGLVFLPGAMAAQAANEGPTAPTGGFEGVAGADGAESAAEADTAQSAPPVSATDPRSLEAPVVDVDVDPNPDVAEPGDPIGPDEPVPAGFVRVAGHLRRRKSAPQAIEEAGKFVAFAGKKARAGGRWRDFEFVHVDAELASKLNGFGRAGELAAAKALVADMGKAKLRRVTPAEKAKLVGSFTPRLSGAVAALMPRPGVLVAGWNERAAATKAGADRPSAVAYVREQIPIEPDVYDDLDDELGEFVRAGHGAAYDASLIDELEDEEDETDSRRPGRLERLGQLIDSVPGLRDALVLGAITVVTDALLSRDPEGNVAAALSADPEWIGTFATVELTATLTAGALDAATAQRLAYVELVASAGDCEFCDGYDGRIMSVDETGGMPPLHAGCQCDIEALD